MVFFTDGAGRPRPRSMPAKDRRSLNDLNAGEFTRRRQVHGPQDALHVNGEIILQWEAIYESDDTALQTKDSKFEPWPDSQMSNTRHLGRRGFPQYWICVCGEEPFLFLWNTHVTTAAMGRVPPMSGGNEFKSFATGISNVISSFELQK